MKNLKRDAIYLGAPLFLSRAISKDFKYLQERLESMLMGWRSKCLSWAGRSNFIYSVAQAIPNYAMSTSAFYPKCVSNWMKFWWKPKETEGSFVAWKSWDKLCKPKCEGGLGFKKAKLVNLALLANLAWLVGSNRDCLCMKILRAEYKVRSDWIHNEPPKTASPIWKAIESAKKIIVKGA